MPHNYRPLALATVLSEVLEQILLDILPEYKMTTHYHCGFKNKNTNRSACVYTLKKKVRTDDLIRQYLCASRMHLKHLATFITVNCSSNWKLDGIPHIW